MSKMIGVLIAESLRADVPISGAALHVTKILRAVLGAVGVGQPLTWTFIEFEVDESDAQRFARVLESSLRREGGWYCDLRGEDETIVVFADRTFRYPRGDELGRAAATEYARSVGLPEAQVDWTI